MKYNWQQADWPHFHYNMSSLEDSLFAIAEKIGWINGKLSSLNNELQDEALIDCMVDEAITTSEIEGEYLSRTDVRSSVINVLGKAPLIYNKQAEGLAKLMLDVRASFREPLTREKLFDWHRLLMLNASSPSGFRTHIEPMQIISGYHGKWTVHYEAPPSSQVPAEMKRFLHWFNQTIPKSVQEIKLGPIRAAMAHLYFESIHPFDDGNGRIGRAIAEKALSQGWGHPILLSLSKTIEAEKKGYYAALNKASYTNDMSEWIYYFVQLILKAQTQSERQINFIFKKSSFLNHYQAQLNERQLKVVTRMLQAGESGFEGGISAKKYIIMTGASKATATRDLGQMVLLGVLHPIGGGRSARYELNLI